MRWIRCVNEALELCFCSSTAATGSGSVAYPGGTPVPRSARVEVRSEVISIVDGDTVLYSYGRAYPVFSSRSEADVPLVILEPVPGGPQVPDRPLLDSYWKLIALGSDAVAQWRSGAARNRSLSAYDSSRLRPRRQRVGRLQFLYWNLQTG